MAKQEAVVQVGVGLVRVIVSVVGLTPLLMNRMTAETLEGIRRKTKKPKTQQRPEKPRDEAAPKVYQTEDGRPYWPVENLFSCWVGAGQFVRLDGKRQVSSAKSTVLPAFLTIEDPVLLLVENPSEPAERWRSAEWEVDMRQGRNPNGGEAVCLVRPRFDKWGFRVSILVDTAEVGINIAREVVEQGGKRMGLGDFRPQKRGPFGKYSIVRWDEQVLAEAAE